MTYSNSLRALDDAADLTRYLALKAEVKRLTAEMKALEPVIYDALTDEDDGTAEIAGVRLEACVSRTYTYSPAVQEAEAALRSLKAKERKSGAAVVERATGYVRVSEAQATQDERRRAEARAAAAEAVTAYRAAA